MKKVLIVAIFSSLFCAGLLQAAERVVAAVPRSFPPYYIEDSTGVMTGFAIEVMDQIARELDIMVEYQIYDSWSDVYQAVREGQADLIPNVSTLPQHAEWLEYSRPLESVTVSIWVLSESRISGADDLNGLYLAVVRGSVGVQLASGIRGVRTEIMHDPEDAIFMLLAERVGALIYPDPVVVHISDSVGVGERLRRVGEPLAVIDRAIGVRRGVPDLLERIDAAVAELIESQTYRDIYARWMMPEESFWKANRITISVSSIALLIVILVVIWRYATIVNINAELRYNVRRKELAQKDRDRLITAIEQAAETILITDAEGSIMYANPAFTRVSGYAVPEVLGKNPRLLKSGRHDDRFYVEMWRTLSGGHVWQGHLINRRRDGGLYEEDASISPVKDREGRIVSYVAVKRDITKETRLEKQLRQSQKMEAIGTLAGGIAHDFNNILGIILGCADVAMASESKEKADKYLNDIMGAGLRARDLVQQILNISRMGERELRPIQIELVVKETLKLLRASIPATIAIEGAITKESCLVLAEPTMLHQIVVNLATNAYQAMKDGGGLLSIGLEVVDIDAEQLLNLAAGRYVRLIVSDSGPGIEPGLQERIFDPYFTTKQQGEGTGLGLSIVQSIVERLGGVVNVYSEPGQGSSFKVYLPLLAGDLPAPEEALEDELPLGSERILVVDDEEMLRNLLKELLARMGYAVSVLADPEEALVAMADAGYDLMITDLSMPKMSGIELVRRLRQFQPELPVILCTGFYDEDVRRKAEAVGIRYCLNKPVAKRELALAIRDLLDK